LFSQYLCKGQTQTGHIKSYNDLLFFKALHHQRINGMAQPKALFVCSLTELWERFGFYTLESLLVLYLIHRLSYSDSKAYALLGTFTALAFITPIIGGWLADKVLGFRYAIIIGGILLTAGYVAVGLGPLFLTLGLSLVIAGNGLLKPNISSLLGLYYQNNDERRDAGFTLFYVGYNLGIVLATTSVGFINRAFGWHIPFFTAAAGMLLGLLVFRLGYRYLAEKGFPQDHAPQNPIIFLMRRPKTLLAILLTALLSAVLLHSPSLARTALPCTAIILVCFVLYLITQGTQEEKKHLGLLLVLIFAAIIFWGLYFQIFFVVNLFTDRLIDKNIAGFAIPTTAFLALEALFIFILGPLMAWFWKKTHQTRWHLSTPMKFSLCFLITGLAMQLLAFTTHTSGTLNLVSPLWLLTFYLLLTLSELLISPIGLAMITELAPKKHTGVMMGAWFMSLGLGGYVTGLLAEMAAVPKHTHSLNKLVPIYHHAFQSYAWIAYLTFVILLLLTPLLKKLMT
jgi:POT family proton-dependent oligopeptide transporter